MCLGLELLVLLFDVAVCRLVSLLVCCTRLDEEESLSLHALSTARWEARRKCMFVLHDRKDLD